MLRVWSYGVARLQMFRVEVHIVCNVRYIGRVCELTCVCV